MKPLTLTHSTGGDSSNHYETAYNRPPHLVSFVLINTHNLETAYIFTTSAANPDETAYTNQNHLVSVVIIMMKPLTPTPQPTGSDPGPYETAFNRLQTTKTAKWTCKKPKNRSELY